MDLESLNKLSPLISAAVTVVLALLTAVYVVHTKRLAEVAKAQATPLVIARIEPFAHRYAQLVLSNVGGGPALDVELKVTLDEHLESHWRHKLLESGRTESFFLPQGDNEGQIPLVKDLAAHNRHLRYTLRYRDRSNVKTEKTEDVRFAELLKDWDDANWDLSPDDAEVIAGAIKSGFNQVATQISRAIVGRRR